MGNDQFLSTRHSIGKDKISKRQFYERTNVSEFILGKIRENIEGSHGSNWEQIAREGRTRLRNVHKTHENLLEFNANREREKLQNVLKALKKHRNELADQMGGTISVQEMRKELEEHSAIMDKLTKEGHIMARIYAEYLQEATMQVNAIREMSIEEKIKMREAREKDLMEESYQRKVLDVKKQIQKLKMLKEKLESTLSESTPASLEDYHSTYLDYILERIRLSLVIFERDVQNLTENKLSTAEEAGKELLKCVGEGNEAISMICALESEREASELETIHTETKNLVKIISKLEEIGVGIPEIKVNNYLKKLLEEHRKAEESSVLTLFLALLVVILVYFWMNI